HIPLLVTFDPETAEIYTPSLHDAPPISVVALAVNVQLKSVDAPAANVEVPPVKGEQPVPTTETPVIVESPVLVSVTVIVTGVPDNAGAPVVTPLIVTSGVGCITLTVTLV